MSVHQGQFGESTGRDVTRDSGGDGGNGGGYHRLDERLRSVELDVRGVTTKLQDIATKSDIDIAVNKMKIWALVGCVIGTIAIIGWLVRLIANPS